MIKKMVVVMAVIAILFSVLSVPVQADTKYCGMWLQPHFAYSSPSWMEHRHWLTADSGIDLASLTNSGKAKIFFYDEGGNWREESLSSWTTNQWGIPTRFAALHENTWFQYRWYISYQCD